MILQILNPLIIDEIFVMKLLILIAIVFVLSGCVKNKSYSQHSTEQIETDTSCITFFKKICDFGCVKGDTTLIAIFPFISNSDKKLRIYYINTSCDCISYFIHQNQSELDTSFIQLIFRTYNKVGKQQYSAFVHTNTKPEVNTLIVEAEIK